MAVANFQYITRMSSGFKVYILEGQPHLRSEDRFRHLPTEPPRGPSVYPGKRKRTLERGLTLEERRERALTRTLAKASEIQTEAVAPSNCPQSPSTTWSLTSSPTSPVPSHVYYAPIMDEPLALIKKPRKDSNVTEEKPKNTGTSQIQMRPSVITCVSSLRNPTCRSDVHKPLLSVVSQNYDSVVDEHFQRSLGENYQKVSPSQQLSISVSVDDHFAKALGEKWQQIKCKSSSCSSTPPSSPSVTHSPTYTSSPYHRDQHNSSRWSIH